MLRFMPLPFRTFLLYFLFFFLLFILFLNIFWTCITLTVHRFTIVLFYYFSSYVFFFYLLCFKCVLQLEFVHFNFNLLSKYSRFFFVHSNIQWLLFLFHFFVCMDWFLFVLFNVLFS